MKDEDLIILQALVYKYYGILFLPAFLVGLIIIWTLFVLEIVCGPVGACLLLILLIVIYTLSIFFRLAMKQFFENAIKDKKKLD